MVQSIPVFLLFTHLRDKTFLILTLGNEIIRYLRLLREQLHRLPIQEF